MTIKTFQFGEVTFDDSKILFINEGIFGFEDLKKYLLIKDESELFYWLNSVEEPEICFPLVGLRVVDDEFPQVENFEAFGIVKFCKEPINMTVNMKAPVYINQDDKIGYQKIIDNDQYQINYPLFKA